MLKLVKIALVVAVCLWGAIGALGNVLDWESTQGSVAAVSSMTGFEGGQDSWRATSNTFVIFAGALSILSFKIISATLCGLGAYRMWCARSGSSDFFGASKQAALAGCGVAVFGLFLGWIVLGEQWFEMWRSPGLAEAGASAFRYAGFIGIIAVFVAMPEETT